MPFDDETEQAAAAWFAASRRGAMSLEERQAYDQWRADPVNQAALSHMHELWGEVSAIREFDLPASRPPVRSRMAGIAAAFCIVVAAAGGGLYWMGGRGSEVHTGIGEQRAATLSDGSVVALNVMTRARYDIGDELRTVKLEEGEATFFVQKDATRPFVVHADGYQVTAVGTAFNVQRRDGMLDVAVKEGVVTVRRDGGGPTVRLAAGQRLHLVAPIAGSAERLLSTSAVSPIAVQSVDEWRLRIVSYADAPASQVIADINRFYARPVGIGAPSLEGRRVTLRLKVDERTSTVAKLADLLDADVRHEEDRDVLVPRT